MLVFVLFLASWILPGLSREALGWKPGGEGGRKRRPHFPATPSLPPWPPCCKPRVPGRGRRAESERQRQLLRARGQRPLPPPPAFLREGPERSSGGRRLAGALPWLTLDLTINCYLGVTRSRSPNQPLTLLRLPLTQVRLTCCVT